MRLERDDLANIERQVLDGTIIGTSSVILALIYRVRELEGKIRRLTDADDLDEAYTERIRATLKAAGFLRDRSDSG